MKRAYKITVSKAANREWFYSVSAGNGEVVCVSETYKRKSSATKAAEKFQQAVATATIKVEEN